MTYVTLDGYNFCLRDRTSKRPVSGVVATVPLETVGFGNIKDVRRRVLRVPAEIVPNVEPTYWLDGWDAVRELRKYEEQIDRWLDVLADNLPLNINMDIPNWLR
jgi:hypothetical protein